jgi:CRISPR-associated Csx2 family protein
MSRKIFISFLGSSNYGECKYVKGEYKSESIRYIQEATLDFLGARNWEEKDKAFVLVTDGERGSFKKNWLDDGQVTYNTKEIIKQPGLETRIKLMNLPFDVEKVHIKDGNSEDEIWEIFDVVYNLIKEADEVFIDITHGFRYLPMLTIVLSNYGKLLKNITVKSITYGNYESRVGNEAPLIDLTSFSQLQDWTNASNLFVNHGNLDGLVKLTKHEIIPILKETKGKDKTASDLRKLSETLESISLAIKTNNAPSINSGKYFAEFKQRISDLENNLIKPLNPIIEKIEDKIGHFSVTEDVKNGFRAVDFCIDSGLIQQAYTMLQESIISFILSLEELEVKNVTYRNIVSGSFKIYKEEYKENGWKGDNGKNIDLTKKLLQNDMLQELSSIFNSLTEKRNIINHAGFNNKSSDRVFRNLEKDVKDLYKRVKEKVYIQ